MGKYSVACLACNRTQNKYDQICECNPHSLLRTFYENDKIFVKDLPGMWRYYDWLPVEGIIDECKGRTISYKSEKLASYLGLSRLWIAFNGYWPERDAYMMTSTFKDLESFPTMQRVKEQNNDDIMVVASAGNTARAFAHVCSLTGQPLLLVVPEKSVHRLWTINESTDSIFLLSVDGDYTDAITLANKIAEMDGFINEGGAKNVARRDGMGTVMLDAVMESGELPEHYFQAVGSGTGGIAVWEASMRLIGDGRFGDKLPKLHLAQNMPCAPLYKLWSGNGDITSTCPNEMYDDVLFNRKPPFDITGGVRDALESTNGLIYPIENYQAQKGQHLFEELEGIDINPASAVAVASLIQAVKLGHVGSDETILLNITGGGKERLKRDMNLRPLEVSHSISVGEEDIEMKIIDKVSEVLRLKRQQGEL